MNMTAVFWFFLRLLFCLMAAKLLLRAVGVESRGYILGLTGLFMANLYWFLYLMDRDRYSSRPPEEGNPPDPGQE